MAFTKVPDCKLNSRFQERFDVAIEISGNLQSEEKNKLLEKEILSNLPSPQEEEQKRDPKERQNVCTRPQIFSSDTKLNFFWTLCNKFHPKVAIYRTALFLEVMK